MAPILPLLLIGAHFAGAGAMGYWASTNVYQTGKISADKARELAWEKQKYLLQHQEFLNEQEYEASQAEIDYLRDIAKMDRYQQYEYLDQAYQTGRDAQLQGYELARDHQLQGFERSQQNQRLMADFFSQAANMEFDRQQQARSHAFGIYENRAQAGMQQQRLDADVNMAEFQQARDLQEREIYLEEKAFESVTGNSFSQLIGDETNVYKLTYLITELEKMTMPKALPRIDPYSDQYYDMNHPIEYAEYPDIIY